ARCVERGEGLRVGGYAGQGYAEDERDGKFESGADGKREATSEVGEAWRLYLNLTGTGTKIRESEATFSVGYRSGGQIRIKLSRGDFRGGNNGAGRVGHTSAYARIIDRFLRA
ncbi:MAG TPA: hypothetical protein VGP79_14915, partial [Bryobacteraceae bacterium]|nr:hypothetical protein [Bryobacteraceae bacterium]